MDLSKIEISTDPARVDLDLVHHFLSNSYWASGRSREMVERSIQNSLCFSAFSQRKQVAFGRAISDRAVFGYIADVFVIPECRGAGIGKMLIRTMLNHDDLRRLQVILLRTRDAGALYAEFGFHPAPRPEELMGLYK